jgi:hypothetical protein
MFLMLSLKGAFNARTCHLMDSSVRDRTTCRVGKHKKHARERAAFFKEIITGSANLNPAIVFGVDGAGLGQGEWREDGGVWIALKD